MSSNFSIHSFWFMTHILFSLKSFRNVLSPEIGSLFGVAMKFLIIQKISRDVPTDKWARLLPLQFKYFDELEKQKRLEVTYHLIGQQGSMLVVNADSEETLSSIIGEDPMFFYMDREVYPLTTRENHEKQIRKILQD